MPSNTLLFRAAGPQVGVVLADGTVQLCCVTLGRDFGKTTENVDGVLGIVRNLAGRRVVKIRATADAVADPPAWWTVR